MGRRNRRREDDEPPELVMRGFRGRQVHADGEWEVMEQLAAPKEYRCPGCDQIIAVGSANIDRRARKSSPPTSAATTRIPALCARSTTGASSTPKIGRAHV